MWGCSSAFLEAPAPAYFGHTSYHFTCVIARATRVLQARFLELLRLRYSSPLLRLPRAEHIQRQVRFLNTGPQQARQCLDLGSGPAYSAVNAVLCAGMHGRNAGNCKILPYFHLVRIQIKVLGGKGC